jgi:hypothetical protein
MSQTPRNETKEEIDMERSNRVSIQVVEGAVTARFWRTHRMVKEIAQTETGFIPTEKLNATANRELFRAWIVEHANEYGIQYDPEDRREDSNKFPSRYTTDDMLKEWSVKICETEVRDWVNKLATEIADLGDLTLTSMTCDAIATVNVRNGKPVEPKYGNGAWAYAEMEVSANLTFTTKTGAVVPTWVIMNPTLLSGQMKKPSSIGQEGWNYTALKKSITTDLGDLLKTEDAPKTETPAQTPAPETPADVPATPESTPEKPVKRSKKSSRVKEVKAE